MNLSKAVLVLRGYSYEQVDMIASVLCEHAKKIKSLEITLNTENALSIIERISDKYHERLLIGAGTVLSLEEVKSVHHASGKFILSPVMLEKEAIEYCKKHGIISVPAAMTPSEAYRMHCYGADIIKIFPARLVGPEFFGELKAPMEFLKLMAVGGVSSENVGEFFKKGADFVGTASGIFHKQDILNCDKNAMISTLERFEKNMP